MRIGPAETPQEVSLLSVVRDLEERGMQPPFILRFSDILAARLSLLNETFRDQMRVLGYQGEYRGVYPVKVNQQEQVVQEVVNHGAAYHHGLEAGSKAELIAAITYLHDPQALIICNGYKDAQFIDLALLSRKMGLRTILIVEMPSELDVIINRSRALGIEPELGVRVKLATPGSGHWLESGGDQSVFGLNAGQVVQLLDRLSTEGMLHQLVMLHFHLGSQIPNIQTVRAAAEEGARLYVGMVQEGAAMGFLNIGGGLAVDYDGSRSDAGGSSNYDLQEYCADVVEVVRSALDETGTPHPTLVSESGRSVVAHYAVLVFDILDVAESSSLQQTVELPDSFHEYTHYLAALPDALTDHNLQECFNDATFYRDQLRSMFCYGKISLRERGFADLFFNSLIRRIMDRLATLESVPRALATLKRTQADVYYGNFSLFQSLPDAWAIDQLFPVAPLHRLNEPSERAAVIADITCDCDGKIDRFLNASDPQPTLPLHARKDDEPYYIGVFLIGAYQETLGDLHNLFGDPNVVTVRLGGDGRLEYTNEVPGDSISDVLSYVEFDPKQMRGRFCEFVERKVRTGAISAAERRQVLSTYDDAMRSYTYLSRS